MYYKELNMNLFKIFLKEEHGATAAEYAIIIALIALIIIGAVRLVGQSLGNKFGEVSTGLQ